MKTLKLTLYGMAILFGTVLFGQSKLSDLTNSNQQNAELRMDYIGNNLNLSQNQKDKITVIRKNTLIEQENLKLNRDLDNSNRGIAMKALRVSEREQILKILTPEQAVKYQSMKQERQLSNKKHHKRQNVKQIKNKRNRNHSLESDRKEENKRAKAQGLKANSATLNK